MANTTRAAKSGPHKAGLKGSPRKWQYNHRTSTQSKIFYGITKCGLSYAFGAKNTPNGAQPFLLPFQIKVQSGTLDKSDPNFNEDCEAMCEQLNIKATLPRRDSSKFGMNVAHTFSYRDKKSGEQKSLNRYLFIGDLSDESDIKSAAKETNAGCP